MPAADQHHRIVAERLAETAAAQHRRLVADQQHADWAAPALDHGIGRERGRDRDQGDIAGAVGRRQCRQRTADGRLLSVPSQSNKYA